MPNSSMLSGKISAEYRQTRQGINADSRPCLALCYAAALLGGVSRRALQGCSYDLRECLEREQGRGGKGFVGEGLVEMSRGRIYL